MALVLHVQISIDRITAQSRSQSGAEYAQHAQNIAEHARGRPSADRKLYYFTIYMQYSNKKISFNNNNNNVGPVNYYYWSILKKKKV